MSDQKLAARLNHLYARCQAWAWALDAVRRLTPVEDGTVDPRGPDPEAILEELAGTVTACGGVVQRQRPYFWMRIAQRLRAPTRRSALVECERCEEMLLEGYERACELALPVHVASVLLRHHGALKRVSYQRRPLGPTITRAMTY